MPTPKKGARLGGSPAHQRLIVANLATALFEHGRITTTEARARVLRPVAEKLITRAKKAELGSVQSLHNRREVLKTIRDKSVVHTLFTEIAPRYAERPGGYTRITKIGPRKGDNAPMAVIELVEALTASQSVVKEGEKARGTRTAAKKAPSGRTREIAEDASAESATAAAVATEAAENDIEEPSVAAADEAALESGEDEGSLAAIGLADDEADAATEADVEDSATDAEVGAELAEPGDEDEPEGESKS